MDSLPQPVQPSQPIPRGPMSYNERMLSNWANKSYRSYTAESCNEDHPSTIVPPEECICCGRRAFSPVSEKHNSVLSYRYRPSLMEVQDEDGYYMYSDEETPILNNFPNWKGLVAQKGLCCTCRCVETRKFSRRHLAEDELRGKMRNDITGKILDYMCGEDSDKAFANMRRRLNLYHTLAQVGMFKELTFYFNRTLKLFDIWERGNILDHILIFLLPGYPEKAETFGHRHAG